MAGQETTVTYRISGVKGFMLGCIAIIADFIQFIVKLLWLTGVLIPLAEIIGWMVAILAAFLISAGLMTSRVSPIGGARGSFRAIVTFTFEGMPLINAFFPAITWWTMSTIRQSRREDRERSAAGATMNQGPRAFRAAPYAPKERSAAVERRMARRVLRTIPHPVARAASMVPDVPARFPRRLVSERRMGMSPRPQNDNVPSVSTPVATDNQPKDGRSKAA
jgi:hypothetical protein